MTAASKAGSAGLGREAADEGLKLETEVAQATGVASPTSWWRLGLVALLLVPLILLAVQFLGGNKGTDVVPGTPIAAPQADRPPGR